MKHPERRTATTDKIEAILELLEDGRWHTFDEIQQKMHVEADQIHRVIEFLKEYDFITIDNPERRVKLDKVAREFLRKIPTA
jgi:predicted transcriptional regulator